MPEQASERSRRVLVNPGWILPAFGLLLVAAPGAEASHLNPLAGPATAWTSHVRESREALARKNLGAALRAWQEAYDAALGSRRWEGMLEVGTLALRIGEASGSPPAMAARAHRLFLAALLRARQEGSLEGVLRAGEAFWELGDRQVVARAVRMAEHLARQSRDAGARERAEALARRIVALSVLPVAGRPDKEDH
jgi:hypothetical protein